MVIAGLALPTATATYALFALAAIGGDVDRAGRDFAPTAKVIFGLVLPVVTLGAFVALVQRAFELTQIGGIFRGLMRAAGAVIEDVHPVGAQPAGPAPGITPDAEAVVVAHHGPAAVLAAIDRAALLQLASEAGGFVEFLPMIGRSRARNPPLCASTGALRPRPRTRSTGRRPGPPAHD